VNSLYRIEIAVKAPDKRFSPGQFVRAEIQPRRSTERIRIPIEAIVEGNGKDAFVFVPSADGRNVQKMPVRIAELSSTHAIISGGLDGVERVITAGSPYLSAQSTIIIQQ